MTTQKQIKSARQNIKKAQKTWQNMTTRERSLRQPEGNSRKQPGTGKSGNYYRIVIRPKSEVTIFRTHDVGRTGHTQRIAGKHSSGSWATHAWLISKDDALWKKAISNQMFQKSRRFCKILEETLKKSEVTCSRQNQEKCS